MQGALGKFRDISSRRIVRALALARRKESGLCERNNERGVTMKNVIISSEIETERGLRCRRRAKEKRGRRKRGPGEEEDQGEIAGWRRRKEGARERPIRSIHYLESF